MGHKYNYKYVRNVAAFLSLQSPGLSKEFILI